MGSQGFLAVLRNRPTTRPATDKVEHTADVRVLVGIDIPNVCHEVLIAPTVKRPRCKLSISTKHHRGFSVSHQPVRVRLDAAGIVTSLQTPDNINSQTGFGCTSVSLLTSSERASISAFKALYSSILRAKNFCVMAVFSLKPFRVKM